MNIAQGGVNEAVVLYEGKIVEGRVRDRACASVDVQPQYHDWVLLDAASERPTRDVVDWMVRRHVATHELSELDRIRLAASVVGHYRERPGSTHSRLALATGLSMRRARLVDWLQEIDKLGPVLAGDKDILDVGRETGLISEKRGVALGKSYGAGDKFDDVFVPLKRYLSGWKRKGYEFRHVNPKEATRIVSLIESAIEELQEAKQDLEKRAVTLTYTAPPERKVRR
jgi:hypothetical protein